MLDAIQFGRDDTNAVHGVVPPYNQARRSGDLLIVFVSLLPILETLRVPSLPDAFALAVFVLPDCRDFAVVVPARMFAVLDAVLVVIDRGLLPIVVPERPFAALLAVVIVAAHYDRSVGP